jgi:hypothetical protein
VSARESWRFFHEWHEKLADERFIFCVDGPFVYDSLPEARAAYERAKRMAWVQPKMHKPEIGPLLRTTGAASRPVDRGALGKNRAKELRAMLKVLSEKKSDAA